MEIEASGLDKLTIIVDGNRQEIYVSKFLLIDDTRLEHELKENPSQYAWYATVLAHYDYARDKIERELKELRATYSLSIRERYKLEKQKGDKEPTEGLIKEELDTTPIIKDKERQLLQASLVCGKIAALVRGIEKKGDRLAQLYSKYKMMGKFEGGF